MSNTNETSRTLHFSINGDFITTCARERLYEENRFSDAMELLMSCLVCDEMSEIERTGIALQILEGKLRITGTYPGDNYRVDVEPDSSHVKGLKAHFEQQTRKFEELERNFRELCEKFTSITEIMSEYQLIEANENYMIHTGKAMFEGRQYNVDINDSRNSPMSTMLTSFLKQRRISEKFEDNYGWLAPNGEFYPVEWGDHQTWAYDYVKEHYPDEAPMLNDGCAGDILLNHNWTLLHSPSLGVAVAQRSYEKRIMDAVINQPPDMEVAYNEALTSLDDKAFFDVILDMAERKRMTYGG